MGLTIALITESNNQLSEPSTEVFSSGLYSLEPISEPDTRSERGPHPLIVNKDPTILPELRIGIDLSDSATEVNVCNDTRTEVNVCSSTITA